MRVLMVSKACVVGTYQRKLEELARLPGMELTAVVPPHWRDTAGLIRLERQHTEGYDLVVEPMTFNGNYHLHWYPGLGRQMRRVMPDLIHIDEEPYNFATAHAVWLASRLRIRSLFFSWQNLNRRYPLPFNWLETYVLRRVAYAIVGNQDSAQVWRAKRYQGPMAVIPQFGVDPDVFVLAPPGNAAVEQERVFTIGYVGRMVEEKGVDLLLEALAGLEGPWRSLLVGCGPALPALQARAERDGLAGRVSFVGHVPSAEMPGYYRRMDVLVLPSRTCPNWKEQFGRVLVEAMACGVPVIGSDSGEIPHTIDQAGLVFPEGRADLLRECLVRLLREPGLRADLARRGRDRVTSDYTQAQVAAKTYEVYQQMLQTALP